MRRALVALALVACGNDRAAPRDPVTSACAAEPPAFVRHAFLALAGRRPWSQDEVAVYVDLYAAAQQAGRDPRDVVARALLARPEARERWLDGLMEALRVQRADVQSEVACWGQAMRGEVDPALAAGVRDGAALDVADGGGFTMLDLARSALALDDVTPVYRAQLFSMLAHPIPAANVELLTADVARRADFGQTFDAAWLHRDPTCLGCHTSDASVTDRDDPALDRFWPVVGAPEDTALESPVTSMTASRAHAVFRTLGVLGAGALRPWGWARDCGQFLATPIADPAGIDAKLGSITGTTATVFDVERALARGFAALRGRPPAGPIGDPDAALAWLVTTTIAENVFRQVTGASLTLAHGFPRNRASSALLESLASTLARSGYSLRALLSAIVGSDAFARQAPDAGCGASPYDAPDVFDPWAIGNADPALRGNGPGDAVAALDARTLESAAAGALGWPPTGERFPGGDELALQQGLGRFVRNAEPGFRGLDFQARLRWEAQVGSCARPAGVASDVIDELLAAADGTAGDLVAVLKDRLIGEPEIASDAERAALVQLVGPLDAPATSVAPAALRAVCGALLDSPPFLLQGIAGRGGALPRSTPRAARYAAVCAALATNVPEVHCGDRALTLDATDRHAALRAR